MVPSRTLLTLVAPLTCVVAHGAFGQSAATDAPPTAVVSGNEATIATSATSAAPSARTLPDPPRQSEQIHFRFTADVWFPRLDGTTSNGGSSIDLGSGLDLNSTEATFDGTAELRWNRWELALSGFAFDTSGTVTTATPISWGGVTAATGDSVSSSFDLDSVAFEAGYALWRPLSDQPWPWDEPVRNARNTAPNGDYRGDLSLVPFAGGRWLGIDQDFTNGSTGASASFSSSWLALYGGLRLELAIRMPKEVPFLDRLVISAGGAFGGVVAGGSGTYYQVRAGLDLYVTYNIALSAGYQLIEIDASEDSFDLNGGLQGLWVGATVWF